MTWLKEVVLYGLRLFVTVFILAVVCAVVDLSGHPDIATAMALIGAVV